MIIAIALLSLLTVLTILSVRQDKANANEDDWTLAADNRPRLSWDASNVSWYAPS